MDEYWRNPLFEAGISGPETGIGSHVDGLLAKESGREIFWVDVAVRDPLSKIRADGSVVCFDKTR